MSLNRFNIPFIAAGALMIIVIAMVLAPGRSRMTLQNASGQEISAITVRVDDKEVTFTDVPPGAVHEKFFLIWADSSYQVEARLASGQTLRVNDGYVTNGSRADGIITIGADRIDIEVNY